MQTRTRTVVVASLVVALAVGFFVAGGVLYKTAIDLDAPAFPAGGVIDRSAQAVGLDFGRPIAGPFWALATLLAVLIGTFVAVRGSIRARETDPGRRGFLRGAAGGAVAAVGATAVAGAAAWARAFRGIGNEGRGWEPVFGKIFDRDLVFTNPEYPEDWKGARIGAYRRLGRTDFQVSDIVLGTGASPGRTARRSCGSRSSAASTTSTPRPTTPRAGSEEAVGKAIQGHRDQVFVATKFCTPRGHLGAGHDRRGVHGA